MKKIINLPEKVVDELCQGFVLAHDQTELIPEYRVIARKHIDRNKVTLISGGGSGHEPAHAGYVGFGMLHAAVCGDVFASPSQIQIYNAIKAVNGTGGTLLIIKNYSGDVMNFQNAGFIAELDGMRVDSVKVDDDIAVMDSLYTVGRRGVAGTVLVHKVAGAAAEEGRDLAEVKRVAQKAVANVRSVGFAYTSCTVPAKGSLTFALAEDEMEYGVGIHGEPGICRENIVTADEIATRTTTAIVDDLKLESGCEIVVMINGFGATPLQELYILNLAVIRELADRGISIFRAFVGNFMTSIDMAGASVSLMKLDEELKTLIAAPCATAAFKINGNEKPVQYVPTPTGCDEKVAISFLADAEANVNCVSGDILTYDNIIYLIDKMAEIIVKNEVSFCELDSHAGDGDFGMSIAKGFKQLKREWTNLLQVKGDIGMFLDQCSMVIMEHCGGASGPIWGFAFKYAAKQTMGKSQLTVSEFAAVLRAALAGIQEVSRLSFGRGAEVGDKTLVDAFSPCVDAWAKSADVGDSMANAFAKGAAAAVEGAKKTEKIVARMGRAGTVGERSIGYPDAGAHALGVIFTELANSLYFE